MSSWKSLFLSPFLCLNRRIFSQITTYPSSSPPSRLCSVTIFSIRPTWSFLFKTAHWLPTGLASLVAQWQSLPANAEDAAGWIPESGRSPGGGHGNPLQYSCLENPMGRGAWLADYSPWGLKELDMTSTHSTLWEPARPALPGTFLVLTLQVPHPQKLLL